MLLSCSVEDVTQECVLYKVASVQNPANNDYFAVKFQEVDCDSCIITMQFDSEYYNDFLSKLGKDGCLDELSEI